jgi:hypothetical protein
MVLYLEHTHFTNVVMYISLALLLETHHGILLNMHILKTVEQVLEVLMMYALHATDFTC